MPPRKKSTKPQGQQSLLSWLVRANHMYQLLGFSDFKSIRAVLSEQKEGYDEDGRSYMFNALRGHKGLKISEDKLRLYDENIRSHLSHINERRRDPIQLKYYQWLGALFTEIYLDAYFADPYKMLRDVEESTNSFIDKKGLFEPEEYKIRFAHGLDDLRKASFWMATGSGKTFLIHLNYLQFLHYNKGPNRIELDNIMLITPNADLTAQHLRELEKSNIPCGYLEGSSQGPFSIGTSNVLKVVEIHKLTEAKNDGGERFDIESFGKKNLVFVDEAHKGSGGDRWKYFRRELAKEGFTFEYSATFGQAAATSTQYDDNLASYSKSILLDYSYRHFYDDGYGKEYSVLNVNSDAYDTKDRFLLANLMTYYEQVEVYLQNAEIAREYNINHPLWIFVGNKVNVSSEKSDVFAIVSFLHKFLSEKKWATAVIKEILDGKSGIVHEKTGIDIFSPAYPGHRLWYLRRCGQTPEQLYDLILTKVFHTNGSTALRLINLKGTEGEIGLKCGDNPFFGDIYVGDEAKFLNIVKNAIPEIVIEKIENDSLFKSIESRSSKINILIGAKRFIEGWDSYRVSCMGLLNVGKNEGTEIIQLFGRGVRLKGKNGTLKRSTPGPDRPDIIPLLETLHIFGVEAEFVGNLRAYLKTEGMEEDNFVEIQFPIKVSKGHSSYGLLIPRWERTGFDENKIVILSSITKPSSVSIDLLPKASVEQSEGNEGIQATSTPSPISINPNYLEMLDWDSIYFDILQYKAQKGWDNFILSKDDLKKILTDDSNYTLKCPKNLVSPGSFEEMEFFRDVVLTILKKTLQATYNNEKNAWMKNTISLEELTKYHGNFAFEKYIIKVRESEKDIITSLQKVIRDFERVENWSDRNILNVFFEGHLFQPLLAKVNKETNSILVSPQGLNDGEERFVNALREYVRANSTKLDGYKIFLLRNLPKVGIGFYKTSWFYPDFLLWIVNETAGQQRLAFIDPKGIVFADGFDDEKIQLAYDIKELERIINSKSGRKITLDSYILSVTPKDSVKDRFGTERLQDFEDRHVLFFDSPKYYNRCMESILGVSERKNEEKKDNQN